VRTPIRPAVSAGLARPYVAYLYLSSTETPIRADAGEFDAAGAHEVDVGLGGGVSGLEGPLLARFAPKDLVVAVGVERGVNVDEVHAGVGAVG